MRVLVFGLSANRGGVEAFILNYVRRILDCTKDIHFDFVVIDKLPDCAKELEARGSRFFLVRNRVADPIHYSTSLRAAFSSHDIDLVWYNVCTLSDTTLLRVARRENVPCLVHSHNSKNMGNSINYLLHILHRTRIAGYANKLCACSDLGASFMFPSQIVDKKAYQVIPNAIDAKTFMFSAEARSSVRKKLNCEDAYLLGNVGRLHPQKNQEFLLRLLKQMRSVRPNVRLLLVGDGPLKEELREEAEKLGVHDLVFFEGAVADTSSYYSAMDCFVFPSLYEGFGIAALEAQASGLPCVLSDSVPLDVKISDCVYHMSTDSVDSWAQKCLALESNSFENRLRGADMVASSIYDLDNAVPVIVKALRSAAAG